MYRVPLPLRQTPRRTGRLLGRGPGPVSSTVPLPTLMCISTLRASVVPLVLVMAIYMVRGLMWMSTSLLLVIS